MSTTTVIRYRTRAERADENQKLIEDVFAELAARRPAGLRYASYRLGDGTSFVHVVTVDDGSPNPLVELDAFGRFQADLAARCDEQPVAADATVVGHYDPTSPR